MSKMNNFRPEIVPSQLTEAEELVNKLKKNISKSREELAVALSEQKRYLEKLKEFGIEDLDKVEGKLKELDSLIEYQSKELDLAIEKANKILKSKR